MNPKSIYGNEPTSIYIVIWMRMMAIDDSDDTSDDDSYGDCDNDDDGDNNDEFDNYDTVYPSA